MRSWLSCKPPGITDENPGPSRIFRSGIAAPSASGGTPKGPPLSSNSNSQPPGNTEQGTRNTPLDRGLDALHFIVQFPPPHVVLLSLGIILVFWGTLAQVNLGLFKAQKNSSAVFFIYWGPKGVGWRIPIFSRRLPSSAGCCSSILVTGARQEIHVLSRKKAGIWLVHFGVILLRSANS